MIKKVKNPLLHSLRVLARLEKGIQPSRRDLIILDRYAATTNGDLSVRERCAAIIFREVEKNRRASVESREGRERLRDLAYHAEYIARQREQRKITDADFLELLISLRQRYDLHRIQATGQDLHE